MRKFTLSVVVMTLLAVSAMAQLPARRTSGDAAQAGVTAQAAASLRPVKSQEGAGGYVDPTAVRQRKAAAPRRVSAMEGATTEMVTVAPEGEVHSLQSRSSLSYYVYWGMAVFTTVDGMLGEFVVADDGYIYLWNPLSFKDTQSYMKLRLNGTEAVMEGPQLIYRDRVWTSELEDIYVARVKYDAATDWYYLDEDCQQIVFDYVDGTLTQRVEDGIMYGLVNADGTWLGQADYELVVRTVTDECVRMPDDAVAREYTLSHDAGAALVKVAFCGSDVYISGLNPEQPDNCVRGTLADGIVTLEAGQYLGINEAEGYHIYFMPAVKTLVYIEEWEEYVDAYEFRDQIALSYDETAGTLLSGEVILVNCGRAIASPMQTFESPTLKPYAGRKPAKPATPTVTEFMEIRDWYNDGDIYGGIVFVVDNKDVDGNYIDPADLYYNIVANGQVFTFTTDVYVDIDEDMTDVPYDFETGLNFVLDEPYHTVYFEDPTLQNIGVQMKYTVDGVTNVSDIAYYGYTESGIAGVKGTADVVNTTYTDLLGRRTDNPQRGLYIVTTTYADGTVKTAKVVRR